MSNSTVTINLVVLNGKKYIAACLGAISGQAYPHDLIEINILDNGSDDGTLGIIENFKESESARGFFKFNLIKSEKNLGMWPGQEELLKYTTGKYVLTMAVDVILNGDFIKNSAELMDKDGKIGAIQPKIYKFDSSSDIQNGKFNAPDSKIIDTCGFKIFKSRRLINIGHGEVDNGQYDSIGQIFGVEGAAPVLRREAIEDIKINGQFIDHDYFWYGDDLDFAWRMTLFGWKQIFAPSAIAWHDRQTTKNLRKSWFDYILRVPIRRGIPLKKRRLDWRNTRFTFFKNDYIINVLKDLPRMLMREIGVFGYTLLFEPGVLGEMPEFIRYLPKMLKKRREIMKKAVLKPDEFRKYLN